MLLRGYLIAYFVLVAAALIALWQSGVLGRIPLGWVLLSAVVAVLLGALLAIVSRTRPPTVT